MHDRVLADYQHEKSIDLASARAQELSKRAQGGEDFDKAAKSLDLSVKTSDSFARTGSIPDVGTAKQLAAAFKMTVGQVSGPRKPEKTGLSIRTVPTMLPTWTISPSKRTIFSSNC